MLCPGCQSLITSLPLLTTLRKLDFHSQPWRSSIPGTKEAECTLCSFLSQSISPQALSDLKDICLNAEGRYKLRVKLYLWDAEESVDTVIWRLYVFLQAADHQRLPQWLSRYTCEDDFGDPLVFPSFEFRQSGRYVLSMLSFNDQA